MENYNIIQLILGCGYAMMPAIGFAVFFNVPSKQLKFCALGGMIGYFIKYNLLFMGIGIIGATFLACAIVSFYGVWWSRYSMAHPKVITVAAIISMIPGRYAYKAMMALVSLANGEYSELVIRIALENGLKTVFIIGAIAFGLATPSLFFYRRKPVI
jgi:uncharacterized membrane protein YjjB (DUF3815 family)